MALAQALSSPARFLLAGAAALLPLVIAVILLLKRNYLRPAETCRGHRQRLPPSPPRLPIIGHLHLVGFLPHINLRHLAVKYGARDYMLVHFGSMPTLVVSSPRAAEAVLRTHDHAFASRPPYPVTDALFAGTPDIAMAVYGEQWRQARKLLTTHMLTVKKVQAYLPGREEEVRTAMARLRWAATASDTVVDMSDLLYSFTTGLTYRAVSGESDDGRNRHIRELLDATVKLVGGFYPESFFPWLGHVGAVRRATYARAEKVKRRWNELFDTMIDDAGKPTPAKQRQPEGFIRQLLSHQRDHGLPREHIKGMLINVFFGGTDTSYMVLEFMVAELIRNPNAMHKLQAELRSRVPGKREVVTEDDLTDMTYLRAVIKETLRLHPPAPLLEPHLSMDRLQIDGYTIPANISVIVNAWAIGRDETVWEDAEEFKPERFIGSEVTFKGNDFELLPFTAGRRICPGVNFSMATLEIMVANLMYHFDWKLPEGMEANGIDMTEVFSSTLHRKEKLLLVPKHVLINNIIGCDN